MNFTLEACIDSVESALAAETGGATRLELCGDLIIGGTTPSLSLFRNVKKYTNLPIHILIRPRFGDFLYTDYEFDIIKDDITMFLEEGCDGIVCGCLQSNGFLDKKRLEQLVKLVHQKKKKFTLHRAFDVCKNPIDSFHQCEAIGIDILLTSGQKNDCLNGIHLLEKLIEESKNTEILIGSGVSAASIHTILEHIPACHFHMSGKESLQSAMSYWNRDVQMGLCGVNEYTLLRTSSEKIRSARDELERFFMHSEKK